MLAADIALTHLARTLLLYAEIPSRKAQSSAAVGVQGRPFVPSARNPPLRLGREQTAPNAEPRWLKSPGKAVSVGRRAKQCWAWGSGYTSLPITTSTPHFPVPDPKKHHIPQLIHAPESHVLQKSWMGRLGNEEWGWICLVLHHESLQRQVEGKDISESKASSCFFHMLFPRAFFMRFFHTLPCSCTMQRDGYRCPSVEPSWLFPSVALGTGGRARVFAKLGVTDRSA